MFGSYNKTSKRFETTKQLNQTFKEIAEKDRNDTLNMIGAGFYNCYCKK
jgi:hypothetical protein